MKFKGNNIYSLMTRKNHSDDLELAYICDSEEALREMAQDMEDRGEIVEYEIDICNVLPSIGYDD